MPMAIGDFQKLFLEGHRVVVALPARLRRATILSGVSRHLGGRSWQAWASAFQFSSVFLLNISDTRKCYSSRPRWGRSFSRQQPLIVSVTRKKAPDDAGAFEFSGDLQQISTSRPPGQRSDS